MLKRHEHLRILWLLPVLADVLPLLWGGLDSCVDKAAQSGWIQISLESTFFEVNA